ncbi:MAG: DUF1592 domain-containing protein [Verrucomicrobiota bacterium]|nr:DUF1592 domain-containing protein [Verrucomicrobiota bacterium]
MMNSFLVFALLAALAGSSLGVDTKGLFDTGIKPFFQQNCIKCHGEGEKIKGKLDLRTYSDHAAWLKDADRIEDIISVIEEGEMPPEKEPKIDEKTRTNILEGLKKTLAEAIKSSQPSSQTPIRRMNRFQYANAVKDLLKLKVEVYPLPERMMRDRSNYFKPETGKIPSKITVSSRPLGKSGLIEPRLSGVAPFPQDLRAEHGFDNRGDHLSLSPLLMESFLNLSRSIVLSDNFNRKNCGVWPSLFEEPKEKERTNEIIDERLDHFLTRAFRRPVDPATLNRYSSHTADLIKSGSTFLDAMKETVSAILASPRFLYLYDSESKKANKFKDYELATRLSFFLWGSIPDDVLIERAASGNLSNPDVLRAEVERMLLDGRLKRFCDSFPSQWLQLDRIISSVPDPKKYPDFYYAPPNYRTTMDMMMEPLLLFETILVEDRPITDLIDSDYSYRSKRLSKWYDSKVEGRLGGPVTMAFERVSITDRKEGGVITSAAVMTMTSGPEETKPITRGAWISGVIFNDPPEPPPADVPTLENDDSELAKQMTLRERFASHRENPDCAGCHKKLDPLGFALENFDAVGRWRDQYHNGREVDSSGILFRKHKFNDVVEFKDAIMSEKDRFTEALVSHLLSFSLGRKLSAFDSPAVDLVAKKVKESDYSLRVMIHEIVQSDPFLSHNKGDKNQ